MSDARGLRAAKSFEEQGPIVLWQVSSQKISDPKKFYLVLDANQKSFGVRLESTRSDDVKVGGAVVTQLRKQLASGYVPAILQHTLSGEFWVPFFTGKGDQPAWWMMLARASPPEIRLIDQTGLIHVRKSSQASYTKKRDLGAPLPSWPFGSEYKDLLQDLLTPWQNPPQEQTVGPSPLFPQDSEKAFEESLPQGSTAAPLNVRDLPEYQKTARDKLARRAKTLRKSVARLASELSSKDDASQQEKAAGLLRQNVHLLQPGLSEITLVDDLGAEMTLPLDPRLSPGAHLDQAYEAIKKARRGAIKLRIEVEKAREALTHAERDLESLREQPLPLQTVAAILGRHHLAIEKPTVTVRGGENPQALPYKTYIYRSDKLKGPVRLLVGKGAEGSDILVKDARANDLWFHIAGSTGSHVIIPIRDLRGVTAPDDLLRMAGILAVFHSKLRENHAGEVYFSRRQHIRKRKGMAPGLWQIDKAETTMMRFDQDELHQILGTAAP